jgi:hypothetical protein
MVWRMKWVLERLYRNGVPGFDPGFTNAISQVQVKM